MANKHNVFISYHHRNDEAYKEELLRFNEKYGIFIDTSVDTGGIDERLPDEVIRERIRDDYLKDSTVTILLVGTETKYRKHVDWEIYSSMYDGKKNKKSGILVILLPSALSKYYTAAHGENEKERIYPGLKIWTSIDTRTEYERIYPYLPARIVDNLLNKEAKISVANWNSIINGDNLRLLIDLTFNDREECKYDLSRSMRRKNL